METLSKIVTLEPHDAYTNFVYGLRHHYTSFMRTILNISLNLQKLEDWIRNC